jgi:medium-chain acyl-[acyl-carrier-protein] hydrolase
MRLLLPSRRADLTVIETDDHFDERPLACPNVALGGRCGGRTTRDNLLAWQGQTGGSIHVPQLAGDPL